MEFAYVVTYVLVDDGECVLGIADSLAVAAAMAAQDARLDGGEWMVNAYMPDFVTGSACLGVSMYEGKSYAVYYAERFPVTVEV